jgi:hypothetical protein
MKKIFVPLLIVLFVSGCSEDFLNKPPNAQITGGNFPANEEDAILALNGAYSSLRTWQLYSGGFPIIDIVSDDAVKGSNPGDGINLNLYDTFTFDATEGNMQRWWATLYASVRKTNLVIEKVPGIDMDAELRDRIVGEAKFLRAYFYSVLVRAFGDAVIVEKSGIDFNQRIPRTSKDQVWNDFIIPELKYAADVLPFRSEYPPEDLGRITKGAAKALLARIYLFIGDFVNAEKYAMEVINSGGEYELEPSFSNVFNVDNPFGMESIFEIGANGANGAALGGNQWGETQGVRGDPSKGWGFGRPDYFFIKSFADDPRLDQSVIFLGETLDGTLINGDDSTPDTTYDDNNNIIEIECYNQKVWTPYFAEKTGYDVNRIIIRYADVLLMAAEALNENNKPDQALIYLNQVRARARNGNAGILPDITTTDKEALRLAIYEERRIELAFEGLRFWDLVRTNRAKEVLGPKGFVEGKNELFPVPQSEIDVSEGTIIQNPLWN